ncbi:MAG: hypothetical protein H6648_06485 [Caldilineae bacterium]|nr:hypothetical protein [Chloroflexota bacterium]MCB9176792.1 hypothetical protein [Caldilineae bacterium]
MISTKPRDGGRAPLIAALAALVILAIPTAVSLASGPGETILPEEQAVVDLVNQERTSRGKNPLYVNYQLQVAAWLHNEHMVSTGCFSHTACGDGGPSDRVKQSGYKGGMVGENIAWGQRTPAAVMDAWMNSSGHRANILSDRYIDIGVAYNPSGPHWTQVFAVPDGSVPTVTPPAGGGNTVPPCDLPDFDEDRRVTEADLDFVSDHFMLSSEDAAWNPDVDLVEDGVINVFDLYEVAMHVGETCD